MAMNFILAAMAGAFILFFSYLRLLWKRLILVYKLNKLSKEKNYTLEWFSNPFLSVFHSLQGFDFALRGERTYYVTLFSTRHRLREHFFASPTELYVSRKFRLFRAAGGRVISRINEVPIDLGTKLISIDLTEKAPEGAETVLLFYPVARDVLGVDGTKKIYLGNGDTVFGDYRLYTLSAFLEGVGGSGLYRRKKKIWHYD